MTDDMATEITDSVEEWMDRKIEDGDTSLNVADIVDIVFTEIRRRGYAVVPAG